MGTMSPLAELSQAGVSVWLDDLSRHSIHSGHIQQLIDTKNVVGVTTNPTIFAQAVKKNHGYSEAFASLAARGATAAEAVIELTTQDVSDACDLFHPLFVSSKGVDGRVSIEVEPDLAHDSSGTMTQALTLWRTINKQNLLIKIPATREGLEAITACIATGISVNVTLIFGLERYQQVIDAYLRGLELAHKAGKDLSQIHSVASFFISRFDTEVDTRLTAIGTAEARALCGRTAVANATLAHDMFSIAFASDRAKTLLEAGANRQRPLWASTGVKNPMLPDTFYVTELVARGIVNTMPEATLNAVFDHGVVSEKTLPDSYKDSAQILDDLEKVGVSYEEVTELLEKEGIEKFRDSWNELLETVSSSLVENK